MEAETLSGSPNDAETNAEVRKCGPFLLLKAKTPLAGLTTIPAKTMGIAESNVISTRLLPRLPIDAEDPDDNVLAFTDSIYCCFSLLHPHASPHC